MIEVWKDIINYQGYYLINNIGTVKRCDRVVSVRNGFKRLSKGRLMKPYKGKDGYMYYLLTVNKVSKHFALHRLLAIHFIDNPQNKREVNHKDTNRLNNNLDNLEWATPKENIQHSIRMGTNKQCLPGINNPAAKLTERQVLEIRVAYGSNAEIAKNFSISRRCVGFIKINKDGHI